MKTQIVKINCNMCGKFSVEHEININEHGYFTFPDAYCPECFGILDCVIDGSKDADRRSSTD